MIDRLGARLISAAIDSESGPARSRLAEAQERLARARSRAATLVVVRRVATPTALALGCALGLQRGGSFRAA